MTDNAARAGDVLAALEKSPLPGPLREDLREIVRQTEQAANGLPPNQKLQGVSQGLFDLARIMIYNMIHEAQHRARTWRDVIVECRAWICLLVGIVAVAFIIRPELAEIAAAWRGHPRPVALPVP